MPKKKYDPTIITAREREIIAIAGEEVKRLYVGQLDELKVNHTAQVICLQIVLENVLEAKTQDARNALLKLGLKIVDASLEANKSL